MSTSRGIRAGEFAANEPAPDAAATMAVTVVQAPSALLGEARHVRIQDRVSTTKRPSSHRLITTEAQEDTFAWKKPLGVMLSLGAPTTRDPRRQGR
ncbi:hypothetical protein HU200_047016 [Digitaria exilis]|uniref:Uncharacterized protein n=1 Tax=Digitaria exilis TaxID=1010633 RepID=A0A835EC29_9POAL|nr:hypothetical protein HU200_047016 [Digitaria exilis]